MEQRREREKENSLGFPSCNSCSDGVVQNSICSVLLHSLPCHPSKTIQAAEKTFRRDHTGPFCSWLVANPYPVSSELFCCLCFTTVSEKTERNIPIITVTAEGLTVGRVGTGSLGLLTFFVPDVSDKTLNTFKKGERQGKKNLILNMCRINTIGKRKKGKKNE